MTVVVGGYALPVAPGTTLLQLFAELGLSPRRVTVERNGSLVPPADFANTYLVAADRVEVVILFEGASREPAAAPRS